MSMQLTCGPIGEDTFSHIGYMTQLLRSIVYVQTCEDFCADTSTLDRSRRPVIHTMVYNIIDVYICACLCATWIEDIALICIHACSLYLAMRASTRVHICRHYSAIVIFSVAERPI
jgi:hypothetical protein